MDNITKTIIKNKAYDSFKDDIKIIDGFQWVPVTDAKAAICFAIDNTATEFETNNEVANTNEILEMVKEALSQAGKYNLEIEAIAFALMALKDNPSLTISQALEAGLDEWDI
jgi:hypothetical protein